MTKFFSRRWLPLAVIIFLTILSYANIFANGFVVDDHVFIEKWGAPHRFDLGAIIAGTAPADHQGIYRPLRNILYAVYYSIFGTNPFGYHLHSLLIHLLATVLVYLVIEKLFENLKLKIEDCKIIAFVAAILFGLHPIHTETVTYIAAGMDTTGIVFFFACFYFYLTRSRNKFGIILSVTFALLAFFTSEITLTLPLLLVLYEATVNQKDAGLAPIAKKTWPYFVLALFYGAVRVFVAHATTRGIYPTGSLYLTMLAMSKSFFTYLTLTVFPLNLMQNHILSPGIEAFVYRGARTTAVLNQSILDQEILFSIVAISLLIFLSFKFFKPYPVVSFSIGWFFVSLLPVADIVPQGSLFNERSAYIASFGLMLLLAFVFYKIYNRYKHLKYYIALAVFLLAFLFGFRTFARNADWRDDVTLWTKDIQSAPTENAYAYFALGNAYNDKKDYQNALAAYLKSVEVNPGFAVGWASLGRTYRDLDKTAEAIANYQHALEIDPGFWEVRMNLNNIYKNL